jgi:hypothetical protein
MHSTRWTRSGKPGRFMWRAWRKAAGPLAKAAAWRVGDQLSLAAFLYAQGNQEGNVEQLLSSTKPLAEVLAP